MVKHIVMWKLKNEHDGMNIHELAKGMKLRLMALKETITEIINIQVGINAFYFEKNYDIILISDFNNFSDLEKYASNSEHLKVAEFVKQVAIERAAVDYEY